ncbi:MAG: ribosome silencing factor [Lachnospiraceae bacterium]|nr:ribosome silencing factor [Lachnospiraceae bacterium]
MIDAKTIVKVAVKAAEEKKGSDIVLLNISKKSVIADYFLIISGANERQVTALTDEIEDSLAKEKIFPKSVEGRKGNQWILLDYGDVVIHVFHSESRAFYDLERIWRDAERIDPNTL